MLGGIELTLCDMQGRLFEMSAEKGYDSEAFIRTFMLSSSASALDMTFNHLQWAGQGYIMEKLEDENAVSFRRGDELYDGETLYWTGYLYRYWHFYTGERSRDIYRQAPAAVMRSAYLPYHSMSPEMAIDRLKNTYRQKKAQKKWH